MVQKSVRVVAALAVVLSAFAAAAQAPAPSKRALTCEEGVNRIEFLLDGKGATLTRIEGPEITRFPDLAEREWTVQVVQEDGVLKFHIANARGALMSIVIAPKTLGRMTWNNPPDSKADFLCEISVS